ncbi:MAG: CPBP family intramembrane metalloprotease [Lachnospiraceae bacterium]
MTANTQLMLTPDQKNMIFENMSDGVMTVDAAGTVTYLNSACANIFEITDSSLIIGMSFAECFMSNKKNRAFNKLFDSCINNNERPEKTNVRYRSDSGIKHFNIAVSLIQPDGKDLSVQSGFPGMIILIEDTTDKFTLRQHEHDCAYIFAGLIICTSLFLFAWSLLRFTLHIYLRSSTYTFIIECITFALFLEIVFMTSFSMRDIGLVPKLSTLKKNCIETLIIAAVACSLLLLSKVILNFIGIRIKTYFIGGSLHGAYVYIFTSFVQEFLARGVIQTSVKYLMRIKYQKTFGIILTSLLFSLMHIPLGFYFMSGALLLSLALGYIYERHGNIWGCVFLHWCCGYIGMCLYF